MMQPCVKAYRLAHRLIIACGIGNSLHSLKLWRYNYRIRGESLQRPTRKAAKQQ